jgi:hypothetical protein
MSAELDVLVLSLALIMGEITTAQRVAGATMLRTSARWRRVRRVPNRRVPLYAIALREADRVARRTWRLRRSGVVSWHTVVPADRVPVVEAVVALPAHLRRALVLRYVTDLGDVDVARCLRLTRRFYEPVIRLALRRVDARLDTEERRPDPTEPESTTGRLQDLGRLHLASDRSLVALHHDLRSRRDRRRTVVALTALTAFVLTAPLLLLVHVVPLATVIR